MSDKANPVPWHSLEIEKVYGRLDSGEEGLTESEARTRIKKYGHNRLARAKKITWIKILFRQFTNSMIYILTVAMIISLIVGDLLDSAIIAAVIALNTVLGFIQEYKAEKSLESIKKMIVDKATVVRDGDGRVIPVTNIVPGDVIEIEAGGSVPADARIIDASDLKADESALTGESEPSTKDEGMAPEDAPLGDRTNMLFMGTNVISGHARAIIVGTGMDTQIGRIASLVESEEKEEVPLKSKLDRLGRDFGIFSIVFSAIIFLVGFYRGLDIYSMFMVALSLVVAAIPEGLPAIVTITLALGVRRMAKKKAIVRKLHAIETLGSTDLICSDKTGTLTQNVITVQEIALPGSDVEITGIGYSVDGELKVDGMSASIDGRPGLKEIFRAAVLCNNASFERSDGGWNMTGDSTEVALLVAALKDGLEKDDLEERYPRNYEMPFSAEERHMATVHRKNGSNIAYVKGAPEVVLSMCSGMLMNGEIRDLTDEHIARFLDANTRLAGKGMRVLGFAYKDLDCGGEEECLEKAKKDLVYLGMMGMIDPPRPEARDSIRICEDAGIKVVMVTGDQKPTAVAIARSLGIFKEGDIAITGPELAKLPQEELDEKVEKIDVYARISPEQKLKIIESAKRKGFIVAMTGDGVNDAPALKKADIGVAMGITGTDVARQASDMVLGDDNFATIQSAISEGRCIFENIKKFIKYTFSGNLGQVLAIFVGILIGLPLPVLAIQVLWINLITDTFPALALSLDPCDRDIMKKEYKETPGRLIAKPTYIDMVIVSIVMIVGILGLFYYYLPAGLDYARSIAFTSIVMFKLWNSLNCRSERKSIFVESIFSNRYLLGAVFLSFMLQMSIIYVPWLEGVFVTRPTELMDILIVIAVASSVVIAVEARKLVMNILGKSR